jgi:hypothetical protein
MGYAYAAKREIRSKMSEGAGQVKPAVPAATWVICPFPAKWFDSGHTTFNSLGQWKFTAPEACYIWITATVYISKLMNAAWTDGNTVYLIVHKNGLATGTRMTWVVDSATARQLSLSVTDLVECQKNDYIEIKIYSSVDAVQFIPSGPSGPAMDVNLVRV